MPSHADDLAHLEQSGLLRRPRTVTPLAGGRCVVDGRELWNFTTNDYLDLAGDERLVEAAVEVVRTVGVGARASALVSGRTEHHERLEDRIARFEGTEAAMLFPTGYAANVGTLAALTGPDDTLLCDRLNHASLVEGCRSSGARFRVYRHTAIDRLARELGSDENSGERWIVTDGVFSMDGKLAPLVELCDRAEQYGAAVLVDDAHGTGVFGTGGRGACEHLGVEDRVAVRVGTLSKAVGTLGGFVVGSRSLVEWLRNAAGTQIYSTALPPAVCAAAAVAFDVIEQEPERRVRLQELSAFLRGQLAELGLEVVRGGAGPIVPVLVGKSETAVEVGRRLEERGFLVSAIRPPTVPRGTARLRVSVTVAHDENVLSDLAAAVRDASR